MDILTILFLAIGLAMDCFAIATAAGIAAGKFHASQALRMALLFGLFQGFMPLVSWAIGANYAEQIASFDHWIALGILGFIGGKMIKEGLSDDEDEDERGTLGWGQLLILSIATSIDALATGLVFVPYGNRIWLGAAMIAVTTFGFTLAGRAIGSRAGAKLPLNVEVLGGVILIGIGVKICLEHLLG